MVNVVLEELNGLLTMVRHLLRSYLVILGKVGFSYVAPDLHNRQLTIHSSKAYEISENIAYLSHINDIIDD